MEGILSSSERQADLRPKGLERVKLFSWGACARRTLEVYRQVLQK
jgi:glycosyltransferase involved in cell wall biosynthesis